jgi:hypothetical protein
LKIGSSLWVPRIWFVKLGLGVDFLRPLLALNPSLELLPLLFRCFSTAWLLLICKFIGQLPRIVLSCVVTFSDQARSTLLTHLYRSFQRACNPFRMITIQIVIKTKHLKSFVFTTIRKTGGGGPILLTSPFRAVRDLSRRFAAFRELQLRLGFVGSFGGTE